MRPVPTQPKRVPPSLASSISVSLFSSSSPQQARARLSRGALQSFARSCTLAERIRVRQAGANDCTDGGQGLHSGREMGLHSYGLMGVDWEERVRFDRLRDERLARARQRLAESELGAL